MTAATKIVTKTLPSAGNDMARYGRAMRGGLPYIYLVALGGALLLVSPGTLFGPGAIAIRFDGALTLILVGAGQTLAILTGGIDLSVGGVISVVTAVMATHLHATGRMFIVEMLAVLLFGAIAGAINGALIVWSGLQPFIITLATWSCWSGIAIFILPVEGGSASPSLLSWSNDSLWGIPESVLLVVVLLLWWAWFRSSRSFIDIQAIGSDRRRAVLTGVRIGRRLIQVYAASGFFAAAAGIWLVSQLASGSPVIGNDYILDSIAAVVIGGASIFGGSASVGATTVGAIAYLIIPDLIYVLNFQSYVSVLVQGVLLLVAVGLTSGARRIRGSQ